MSKNGCVQQFVSLLRVQTRKRAAAKTRRRRRRSPRRTRREARTRRKRAAARRTGLLAKRLPLRHLLLDNPRRFPRALQNPLMTTWQVRARMNVCYGEL